MGPLSVALGTAAAHSSVGLVRRISVVQFERAAKVRSPFPRAMAYAAIGAAEVLSVQSDHAIARALLTEYADAVPESVTDADAVLAEALIAAGTALERPALCQQGLDALASLIGDARAFDRQPVEVAALSDACLRAAGVDADSKWPDGVRAAASWVEGANDAGNPMWDPVTGGGFDGLGVDGIDPNQGAAATLAVLSVLQNAQRFATVPE